MNNPEYTEELEKLREKLNNDIAKYMEDKCEDKYSDLLYKSMELDEIIVKYIKSYNK